MEVTLLILLNHPNFLITNSQRALVQRETRLYTEDGGRTFLRNVGNNLQDYTTQKTTVDGQKINRSGINVQLYRWLISRGKQLNGEV
jgi:hypothetical protein